MAEGAFLWLIPDAYLPKPASDDPVYKSHESVCILNTTHADATVMFDLYFADRPPIESIPVNIPAQSCHHIRMDDPAQLSGVEVPFDVPYGIRVRSDVPITVQYSRMYATTHNISLMTAIAHAVKD